MLQLAVVLLGGQKELVFLSFLQLKMTNTKSGGKNNSPKAFREKILNDTVYTCEKHFKSEDIKSCNYTLILNILNIFLSLSELFFGLD